MFGKAGLAQCRTIDPLANSNDWFDLSILHTIEYVLARIGDEAGPLAAIILVIASNLLRDFSRQDPHDLRIRRRKTPLPTTSFLDAYLYAGEQALARLRDAQCQLDDSKLLSGMAVVCDASQLLLPVKFPDLSTRLD